MQRMMAMWIGVGVIACGDPTDRPEDCTANQFFDDARKLCVTCPAIAQPRCDEGCTFEIVADQNGCAAATCLTGANCGRCEDLSYFDAESLTCHPCDGPRTCADDADPRETIVDGRCVLSCP